MSQYLDKVAEFHRTFGAPILEAPQIPSEERCKLRVNLLQEELNELSEAIKAGDIVEIADALADLQYVLSGAVLEFGLKDRFDPLFDEVQRSNMSKACSSRQEALETLLHYKKKDGTKGTFQQIGEKYVVNRVGDNKVLKSVAYSPANLRPIVYGDAV